MKDYRWYYILSMAYAALSVLNILVYIIYFSISIIPLFLLFLLLLPVWTIFQVVMLVKFSLKKVDPKLLFLPILIILDQFYTWAVFASTSNVSMPMLLVEFNNSFLGQTIAKILPVSIIIIAFLLYREKK